MTDPVPTVKDEVTSGVSSVGIRNPDNELTKPMILFTEPLALDTEAVTTDPLGIGILKSVIELICDMISDNALTVQVLWRIQLYKCYMSY